MAVKPAEDKAQAIRRRVFEATMEHPGRIYTTEEYVALIGGTEMLSTSTRANELDPGPSAEETAAQEAAESWRLAYDAANEVAGRAYAAIGAAMKSGDQREIRRAEAAFSEATADREKAANELGRASGLYNALRQQRTRAVANATNAAGHSRGAMKKTPKEARESFLARLTRNA